MGIARLDNPIVSRIHMEMTLMKAGYDLRVLEEWPYSRVIETYTVVQSLGV